MSSFILLFIPFLTKIPIAVIDSGVAKHQMEYVCDGGLVDLTGTTPYDNINHGSLVSELIMENLPKEKYCIYSIKWIDKVNGDVWNIVSGLEIAGNIKAKFINISAYGDDYLDAENNLIRELLPTTKFFIAAGNAGQDLGKVCNFYPACYPVKHPNFKVVGSPPPVRSNFNGPVNIIENGVVHKPNRTYQGTSFGSPRALNKLILRDYEKASVTKEAL